MEGNKNTKTEYSENYLDMKSTKVTYWNYIMH